jgi:hypothetical protein
MPAPSIAIDADPMAEYERQFDSSPSSLYDLQRLDLSNFNLDQRSFDVPSPTAGAITPDPSPTPAPQPPFRPPATLGASAPSPAHEFAGAPASVPRSFAPDQAPADFAALGPIEPGRASGVPIALPASFDAATTVPETRSQSEHSPRQPETIVVAARAVAHREPLAIGPQAPTAGVLPPSRPRVVSAARGMAIAVLLILVGIGAVAFFSTQSLAGPGELETTGIVTSLGSTTDNSCTPIARFAAEGKSLTADANTAVTPCPVGLGQDVNVIYSAANPASSARIQLGSPLTQYLWVVPVLGFLFFLSALTTFVVRAGSIASGIRLLRQGRGKTGEPVEAV